MQALQGAGFAIDAEEVRVSFDAGPPALDGVSFHIRPGEIAALVGPSGCGKSTLLRLVAGLLQPSQGRLTIEVAEGPTRLPRVAFVFQDPTLLPWRDVADNIGLPLELEGVPRDQRREAIEESLRLIGLSPQDARKLPRMLSGGMRMRVSLARALITQPDILLLDEPFGALDDLLREQLNVELLRLWQTRRPTTLLVTHHVQEAVFVSQRVLLMQARPGRIKDEVAVEFPYPRSLELRQSDDYLRLAARVGARLREVA